MLEQNCATPIDYSPDGKQLAVACADGGVRIYDTATRAGEDDNRHKDAVSQAAFSPDARKLATASMDNSFHISPLRFDELYDVAKRLQAVTSGKR